MYIIFAHYQQSLLRVGKYTHLITMGLIIIDQFASKSINRGTVFVIQIQKPLRSVNQCVELVHKHFSMLTIISRKPLYSVWIAFKLFFPNTHFK